MRKYSNDKDINCLVRKLLKSDWKLRKGKKHLSVISPSGRRLTIPSTPSDRRALKNLKGQIRHIMQQGTLNAYYR